MFRIRYKFRISGVTGTFGRYATREEAQRIADCHNEGFGKYCVHVVEPIDGPS